MIRFGVLGPLRVEREGHPVPGLNALMVRRLLAALLSRAGDLVPVDDLIFALWGEDAPPSARKTLQVYVRRLRSALGEDRRIVHEPAGYRIRVADDELDSTEFSHLVANGRRERAPDLLKEALGLWRGTAFEDVREHAPLLDEARRLDEERLRVEAEWVEIELELGRHDEVIPHLTKLTEAHPFREDLREHLMLALYRAGRQADALELFRCTRKLLDEELGISPGPALSRLHESILRASPELDLAPAPSVVPRELPADVGGFVGRTAQLQTLDAMIPDSSPVVISAIAGTAGVGKTALAVHWARRVASRFPDGQLYLNLNGFSPSAPVRPIEALASMLRSVGVPSEKVPMEEADAAALFRSTVATRQMLIVLDNARSADQVRPLLPGSQGCLVLVTSRNNLSGLVAREGARRLDLDVLSPGEARDLLTRILGFDRALAEPAAVDDLARACAYLPLALRVAAANLNDQPHRTVAAHVDELRSGNRLASLAVQDDDQAAVRSAFDLSYQDIETPVRSTFRQLGLVPGRDFTVDAVAAMAGLSRAEASRHLIRLSNAHLIEPVGQDRYTFHDLLRLYAAGRAEAEDSSGSRKAALQRFCDWSLKRVDAAAKVLYPNLIRLPSATATDGSSMVYGHASEALTWLDNEKHNLVGLIRNAAAIGLSASAWLLADGLRGYGTRSMHRSEWLPAAHAALEAAVSASDPEAESSAYLGLAHAYRILGDFPEAIRYLELAITKSGACSWETMHSTCLGNLGGLYYEMGEMERATDLVRSSLDHSRKAGQLVGEARALLNLGLCLWTVGKLDEASVQLEAAQRTLCDLGATSVEAGALYNLGWVYFHLGSVQKAVDVLHQAVELKVAVGDRHGEAIALDYLARVYREVDHVGEALRCASRSLELAREVGNRATESEALATIGSVNLRMGYAHAALDRCNQALEVAQGIGARQPEIRALVTLAEVLSALGQHAQANIRARSALDFARRFGFGLMEGQALTVLARVELDRHETQEARAHAEEAVAKHRRSGYLLGEADTSMLLADLEGDPGMALLHQQRADEIYAVVRSTVLKASEG